MEVEREERRKWRGEEGEGSDQSLVEECSFLPEPENKIKNIKIRESSNQPVASVDDIKASMMSLKLGPTGIKKATSSQSLNSQLIS